MKDVYYDPSNAGSFSGPDKLYRYVRKAGKYVISKYKIRKWLQRQEPYSLQRSLRKPAKRNRIVVTGIDDQWSADLMDMVKFKSQNDGYSYVLVVIDVFSKFLWMRSLKDKKGESVVKALQDILREGRQPSRIRTDKGQEFRSKEVNKLLDRYGIKHLYAQNESKAAISEFVIKTIKSRLYRYFTHTRNYEYIRKLQSFANSYNQTHHRTIGMAPAKVTKAKETSIWWRMYWPKNDLVIRKTKKVRKPFKFKVGDKVRLSHLRNPFTREYDERWTGEIFTIAQKILRGGLPLYRVKDYDGDEIKGTFYQSELQKVDVRDDDMWKVENIIKTKGKGRNKEYYVKWLNWPKKFNFWIRASDITDL